MSSMEDRMKALETKVQLQQEQLNRYASITAKLIDLIQDQKIVAQTQQQLQQLHHNEFDQPEVKATRRELFSFPNVQQDEDQQEETMYPRSIVANVRPAVNSSSEDVVANQTPDIVVPEAAAKSGADGFDSWDQGVSSQRRMKSRSTSLSSSSATLSVSILGMFLNTALTVIAIIPHGSASRSGVRVGDVLITMGRNKRPLRDMTSVRNALLEIEASAVTVEGLQDPWIECTFIRDRDVYPVLLTLS
eukprot:PhM_4_TR5659/c0_g1_i1/m.11647